MNAARFDGAPSALSLSSIVRCNNLRLRVPPFAWCVYLIVREQCVRCEADCVICVNFCQLQYDVVWRACACGVMRERETSRHSGSFILCL